MARITLLDVNLLVALFDANHIHHEPAHDWFADHQDAGWATCPVTENGFVRVVSQLTAGDTALRPSAIVDHLQQFCRGTQHHFWSDALSLTDTSVFDTRKIHGHRQVTDIYLLGLAHRMDGCLATFDGTIPIGAVKGATRETLHVIAA